MAPCDYKDSKIEKIIKALKYRFIKELSQPISQIMKKYLEALSKHKKYSIISENPIIVPVPLFKRRLNWRGFNQSELIAKSLALSLQLDFSSGILVRTSAAKPQADIPERNIRLANVKNKFAINTGAAIKNRVVILIDDIVTTGATLNECADVLKKNGAKKVIGFVFARG